MEQDQTVVIGAGPYGLAIAAHLKARGVPVVTLGKPMEFWEKMPGGMNLKSVWSASSIADPASQYTLDHYRKANRQFAKQEPIPLPDFVQYGQWFQRQLLPDVDPTYARWVAREGDGFRVELEDGRTLWAGQVVVAVGIEAFAYLPGFARGLPAELISHTQDYKDFDAFKGRTVAVLGRGQSAVQTAAFLHEAGAETELIARGPVVWIQRKLYDKTGPAKHIFYPSSDVGPPGLNWLIHFPSIYRLLRPATRARVEERAIRPSGAKWLRDRGEGKVRVTPGVEVLEAHVRGGKLKLQLSDGTTRLVDHLFAGTGYRPSLDRFAFLDPALRAAVTDHDGYPTLSSQFESSVPGLYFAGAIASYNFGPLCRFVAGSRVAARQISRQVARHPRRVSVPAARELVATTA